MHERNNYLGFHDGKELRIGGWGVDTGRDADEVPQGEQASVPVPSSGHESEGEGKGGMGTIAGGARPIVAIVQFLSGVDPHGILRACKDLGYSIAESIAEPGIYFVLGEQRKARSDRKIPEHPLGSHGCFELGYGVRLPE